jgi:hypothetical protein
VHLGGPAGRQPVVVAALDNPLVAALER